MNNQIKILLTISGIEGATLHKVGSYKIQYSLTKEDLHFKNHGKKYTKEDKDKIVYKGVRKCDRYESVPCSKSIKLTYDAYNYFTSTDVPEWYLKKDWKRLSSIERLELHLQRMCDANRGKSFTYSILED